MTLSSFNTRVRRLLLPLLTAFTVLASGAFAQDDAVILRVDERTETVAGFNDRFEVAIRGLVASMGMPMTEDMRAQLDDLRPEYLQQLASDLVLLNEAERRGITVSDEEITELVEAATAGIPEDQLDGVLQDAGFRDVPHFTDMVRETELIQRLLDSLFEEMEFSDDELQAWWEDNSAQFSSGEQVCAAHILVDELDTANELVAELADGADFAELAVEHSTDPGSGARGGDLGCFGRGMMVAPFEEVAFSAGIGEVAGPVESQFGQHLILVSERIEASEPEFEQHREQAEISVANARIGEIISALTDVADIESHPELLEARELPAAEQESSDEQEDNQAE